MFIGNVSFDEFTETDTSITDPATFILTIDVISAPGTSNWMFHFVTLEVAIQAPVGARFVDHSQRDNYHREVPADPSTAIGPDPDAVFWVESAAAATSLRIRDDETALLSSPGNGRTYRVGIAGLDDPETVPLQVTAAAAASLGRESTCRLVLNELHDGDHIAGYLD